MRDIPNAVPKPLIFLLQAACHEPHPKAVRRIQAVAMAQQSLTGAKIARLTGEPARTLRRWVRRYNQDGHSARVQPTWSGRPTKLPRSQEQAFKHRIDAGPTDRDPVSVMHGQDYQRILETEFGKVYTLNGVYQLLKRPGYSWLVPQPQYENTDTPAQEAFKKAT